MRFHVAFFCWRQLQQKWYINISEGYGEIVMPSPIKYQIKMAQCHESCLDEPAAVLVERWKACLDKLVGYCAKIHSTFDKTHAEHVACGNQHRVHLTRNINCACYVSHGRLYGFSDIKWNVEWTTEKKECRLC